MIPETTPGIGFLGYGVPDDVPTARAGDTTQHPTTMDAWRIIDLADHPAPGTCLNSFHILIPRLRPPRAASADSWRTHPGWR